MAKEIGGYRHGKTPLVQASPLVWRRFYANFPSSNEHDPQTIPSRRYNVPYSERDCARWGKAQKNITYEEYRLLFLATLVGHTFLAQHTLEKNTDRADE